MKKIFMFLSDGYQEAVLPFGEYRIRLVFSFPSDREPARTEHEGVWVDFTIEEYPIRQHSGKGKFPCRRFITGYFR